MEVVRCEGLGVQSPALRKEGDSIPDCRENEEIAPVAQMPVWSELTLLKSNLAVYFKILYFYAFFGLMILLLIYFKRLIINICKKLVLSGKHPLTAFELDINKSVHKFFEKRQNTH